MDLQARVRQLAATGGDRHYEPRRAAGSTPGPDGWYLDDCQAAAG